MSLTPEEQKIARILKRIIYAAPVAAVGVICLLLWGCPQYKVYTQTKEGEAMLAHAQSSKEVAVAEAKAKMESAEMLSKAEVARAKGVAEANKIIGDSLKGNESYLRYLWISQLESNNPTVIYVPTEAGLPILEAGHRSAVSPNVRQPEAP